MIERDGPKDLAVATDALHVEAGALCERFGATAYGFTGSLPPHRQASVECLNGGGTSRLKVFFFTGEVVGDDHAVRFSMYGAKSFGVRVADQHETSKPRTYNGRGIEPATGRSLRRRRIEPKSLH